MDSQKKNILSPDAVLEAELVQRILDGDKDAEEELFNLYSDEILTLIEMKLFQQHRSDLEAIASDVYLTLLTNLRKGMYQPEKGNTLLGYAYGIIRNHLRKLSNDARKNNRFDSSDELIVLKATVKKRKLENEQLQRTIRTVLRGLKPKYSHPYFLRFHEDYSVKDIAAVLDLTPDEVSNRLKYAKDLIRKEIKKSDIFPDNNF